MAIYFGLPVEVIHQMESWTLIRFSGAKFVVDTTDLVVDPEMAAEQVETPAPIMVGGEGDSRKRMAAGREQSSDPALSGQTLGVHRWGHALRQQSESPKACLRICYVHASSRSSHKP
jgi:hypothetical protein